jgi:hypothetical protein
MPTPSVGRDVHYVSYGTPGGEYDKACRAAKITQTFPPELDGKDKVGLIVFNPTGLFLHPELKQDDGEHGDYDTTLCGGRDYPGGTWHWPERVGEG